VRPEPVREVVEPYGVETGVAEKDFEDAACGRVLSKMTLMSFRIDRNIFPLPRSEIIIRQNKSIIRHFLKKWKDFLQPFFLDSLDAEKVFGERNRPIRSRSFNMATAIPSEIPGSSEISPMEAVFISIRFPRRYFCRIVRGRFGTFGDPVAVSSSVADWRSGNGRSRRSKGDPPRRGAMPWRPHSRPAGSGKEEGRRVASRRYSPRSPESARRVLHSLYRMLSTRACHDASMMLCDTPTVPQISSLSPDLIKTRTEEPSLPAG